MKTCAKCLLLRDDTSFNRSTRAKDGLQAYCRDCQKLHYQRNSVRHRANVRRTSEARIARMRQIVHAAMAGGCVDCGLRDIRVLEFDHVRGTKVDSIGRMVRIGTGIPKLRIELDKCEVRCRNCHAIATIARLGKTWHAAYLD